MTKKSIGDQVVEWALARPEFAGCEVERNVELKGQRKDMVYKVEAVLRYRGRFARFFKRGPLSGRAMAITVGKGYATMGERDVSGVQVMAADVFQAVFKGKEARPVQMWMHVTTQPYDAMARSLAGQMRLTWFGYLDENGNIEQMY